VHFSFFLLLAYYAYDGWQAQLMTGLIWSLITIIAFFTCVVLHELGHSFTAMHYGVGVRRILLMPIGGMAEFDAIPREPRKELLITLAGPAVNFVIAAILWWPLQQLRGPILLYSAGGLLYQLFWANVVMGLFNLVPVFPMDGGRIFRAVLATRLTYLKATRWAATVGKVLSVAGILVMIFWLHSFLGALLFGFIFMAGETEYRAVQRREIEDAHWRTMLERLYGRPREEPPVINVTPDK
jgi:Zn-dependent protease